jgi:hypothetical protein
VGSYTGTWRVGDVYLNPNGPTMPIYESLRVGLGGIGKRG